MESAEIRQGLLMKLTSIKYNGQNLECIKSKIKQPIKTIGFADDPKGFTLEFFSLDGIKYSIDPGDVLHFKGRKLMSVTKG